MLKLERNFPSFAPSRFVVFEMLVSKILLLKLVVLLLRVHTVEEVVDEGHGEAAAHGVQ